ncbi:hypothetical protein BKN14_02935 [Candidatus Gracilibacteria bacterium HOT-871]|nr:hypothetical protein BKN14_02935 [Candidatus Gracilibacteria bacterium HOT-871]
MNKEEIFKRISYARADAKRFTGKYNGPENKFIPEKGKKIAISWSGGKDSCYVFCKAKDLGMEVKYLFTLTDPDEKISLTWPYNLDFIKKQAKELGMPLLTIPSTGNPEDIFGELFDFLVSEGIETIGAGHYLATGQREFFQKLLYPRNMSLFEPNLGLNTREHILEILNYGIVPKIILVNPKDIPISFIGKNVNYEFINFLDSYLDFYDYCGEIYAYQTVTVYCPYFKKELELGKDFYNFQIGNQRLYYYF